MGCLCIWKPITFIYFVATSCNQFLYTYFLTKLPILNQLLTFVVFRWHQNMTSKLTFSTIYRKSVMKKIKKNAIDTYVRADYGLTFKYDFWVVDTINLKIIKSTKCFHVSIMKPGDHHQWFQLVYSIFETWKKSNFVSHTPFENISVNPLWNDFYWSRYFYYDDQKLIKTS